MSGSETTRSGAPSHREHPGAAPTRGSSVLSAHISGEGRPCSGQRVLRASPSPPSSWGPSPRKREV